MTNAATLHGLHILVNAVDFFAWYGACGLLLLRAGLAPADVLRLADVQRAWRRSLLACLLLLACTGGMLLVIRSAEMSGLALALALAQVPGMLPDVLLHTHFGMVWLVHLLLLGLLAAAMLLPQRVGVVAALCLAALFALTYSASSHAGDQGDFTFAELNDWAHVLASSLWGGGILATLFFAYPLLRARQPLLAQTVFRLSRVSAVALVAVLATGMANAILRLRALDELLLTDYGRVLAIKMTLVGAMAALGAYSRFLVLPRLRRALDEGDVGPPLKRVALALAADALLIALVLTAAALLIQGMPPAAMRGAPMPM